mmetsp:Transcript_4320/g.9551  ORF Transcript_4320/g.9551 Transcript_4320/m.9551 type:complete len:108 (+) Transcript_4320:372-695(+)
MAAQQTPNQLLLPTSMAEYPHRLPKLAAEQGPTLVVVSAFYQHPDHICCAQCAAQAITTAGACTYFEGSGGGQNIAHPSRERRAQEQLGINRKTFHLIQSHDPSKKG